MLPILKLYKRFWNKIVSGEKKYEFRKLEKGITTGTYEFVSVRPTCQDEDGYCEEGHYDYDHACDDWYEVFGTAHIKPIAVNSYLIYDAWVKEYLFILDYENAHKISKETYDFVKKNYIDKGIDFVVYEISNVKEVE